MRTFRRWSTLACLAAVLAAGGGCTQREANLVQGYIEGEYVYASSPQAGTLRALPVTRGDWVKAGDLVFELDRMPEASQRDEAARQLAKANAALEDARLGKRPSELESLRAQVGQAKAAAAIAELEFARREKLLTEGSAISREEYDRARSTRDESAHRVQQLEADLQTAQLGQRTNQVEGAEAEVRAREDALKQAEWTLSQKRQSAPTNALVFDTLYRVGEWVPAGRPVVTLLPPEGVKLRAFVPETRLSGLRQGSALQVRIDGTAAPISATISFVSPKAEYTSPFIYSRENREKFVFMVEAVFDPKIASTLHPGHPVDVLLPRP
jgi:HlyD family secretion protein